MPVRVNLPGPWTHRDLTAGGTRFHVALAGPEAPLRLESTQAAPEQPLVLLLHGFPECWWAWRHVIPALAQAGHRVAAADLRGFGGSARPPSGYDLSTTTQDASRLVRALGYERAVVVGAGYGGQVAWALASSQPGTVAGIVPVGAPHPLAVRSLRGRAFSGTALQTTAFRIPHLYERRLSTRAGVERLLRSWAGAAYGDAVAQGAGYYAELLARPGAVRCALETVRRRRLSRAESSTLERRVSVPVLSVQGEVDPLQPAQAYARDTHHVVGTLRQVTVPQVGHFPAEEAPTQLVDALLPFLAEVG